jgi:excisionase family DNA binding protein
MASAALAMQITIEHPVGVPYTADEAAVVLRVNADTVRRLCKRGEIAARKVGRGWRIPYSVIRGLVEADVDVNSEVDRIIAIRGQ